MPDEPNSEFGPVTPAEMGEPVRVSESFPTISRRHLRAAVNASCQCGGKLPQEPDTCPACMVWHRLIANS